MFTLKTAKASAFFLNGGHCGSVASSCEPPVSSTAIFWPFTVQKLTNQLFEQGLCHLFEGLAYLIIREYFLPTPMSLLILQVSLKQQVKHLLEYY